MTQEEKRALAQRLKRYADEYERISSRATGVAKMVTDLRAAAAELMEGEAYV